MSYILKHEAEIQRNQDLIVDRGGQSQSSGHLTFSSVSSAFHTASMITCFHFPRITETGFLNFPLELVGKG